MKTTKTQAKRHAAPPDDDDGVDQPSVPSTGIRKELKTKALSGWEGYKCCVRARNAASRFVSEVSNFFSEWGITWDHKRNTKVAYVSPPAKSVVPLTRFFARPKIPPAVLPIVGMEMLDGAAWSTVDEFAVPTSQAQADLATQALRAVATRLRTKTEQECLRCIRKKVWGQKKKRQWVTPRPLRKGPRTRDSLLLRVPHQ